MNSPKTIVLSEDACLVAKYIRTGDEEAFSRLVKKYESLVWNISCRILHNRCDAEDAFQTTFMLLATRAHRIRKPKSLSSWLYGVAFRTSSTIRRQRQRDMQQIGLVADHRSAEDVLADVARRNENELVSAEIMLMREKLRTPLLMFYFMGNSVAEIAATLGLTVSAVEGRLRQARKILKSRLTLRGIGFEQYCGSLLISSLTLHPSLASTVTGNALAASTSHSWIDWLWEIISAMNPVGAKIMITKLAVSFSLFAVVGVGVLHPMPTQDGEAVTNIVANQDQEKEVSVQFAIDDEDVDLFYDMVWSIDFDRLHKDLERMWGFVTEQPTENQPQEFLDESIIVVETDWGGPGEVTIQFTSDESNKAEVDRDEIQYLTYAIEALDARSVQNEAEWRIRLSGSDVDVLPLEKNKTEQNGIQFLEKLPYLGRLFRNVSEPQKQLLPFRDLKSRAEVDSEDP